ncbi:MAG: ribosomal RNA small subunit methyltransferase A [Deltaproteobacteria bacterium GWA2_54_12]|nr:MAG: ribosomal RNA small subunit methyltransferase A [Deltaproteobacteria bacterium GWA2_54_12]
MTGEKGVARPRAKKKFGQHFLNDRNIIRKIVEAAGVKEGDLVLEIGPGTGMLTRELLDAGARVIAVEVDKDLIGLLQERFQEDDLTIIPADALKMSYTALAQEHGGRFKLVANLPYYISGPLLSKLLTERAAFSIMVLMFQKEVAVRIAAGPGNRDYGNLSVLSQAFTVVKREFDVPAHLFSPKPKVDSSVVSFRVLDEPKISIDDESYFRTVVRAAFGTRRKTLSNSLSVLGLGKADILGALHEAGVDPVRRGETLDLNEFARLAHALYLMAGREKNHGTLP